jgi:hypothetical protein
MLKVIPYDYGISAYDRTIPLLCCGNYAMAGSAAMQEVVSCPSIADGDRSMLAIACLTGG